MCVVNLRPRYTAQAAATTEVSVEPPVDIQPESYEGGEQEKKIASKQPTGDRLVRANCATADHVALATIAHAQIPRGCPCMVLHMCRYANLG